MNLAEKSFAVSLRSEGSFATLLRGNCYCEVRIHPLYRKPCRSHLRNSTEFSTKFTIKLTMKLRDADFPLS